MTITLDDLDYFQTIEGIMLLATLSEQDLSDKNTLRILGRLRRKYGPETSGAALEMARLRIKAEAKFDPDEAPVMFFTADALEQASDLYVREYRAWTYGLEGQRVIDACCSIGADSLSMARVADHVLGLDIDPLRIAIARHNAEVLGVDDTARFEVEDVRDPLPNADIIFFDPARRDAQGNRLHHVERYQPPLSILREWTAPRIIVKLSPGVDLEQLAPYGGLVEFISVQGELKEAVLRLGEGTHGTQATLITHAGEGDDEEVDHLIWLPQPQPVVAPLSEPRGWLVEPDASLLRAGLTADAALAFNGAQLDETIAYFTTDTKPHSPWVRAWKILDWMPFGVKPLRAYLRERNVGTVTVKKRGTSVTPDALIPQLKLTGSESRTLVLTRLRGKQIVMICEDIEVPPR